MKKPNLLICLNNILQKQDQSFFKEILIPAIKADLPQIQIFCVTDLKTARHKISQLHFAAVIVQGPIKKSGNILLNTQSLEFLVHLKNICPDTRCLLYTKSLTCQEIISCVNKVNILGIFNSKWDIKDILFLIKKSIDKFLSSINRVKIVEEIAFINKHLETTMGELEKEVQDRTKHIKTAQLDAQKEKLKIERLVHLVQKLSVATDFEEYLLTLKDEYKKWHHIIGPLLIVNHLKKDPTFYYLQGRMVRKQRLLKEKHTNQLIRKTLADILGRPLGQLFEISFGKYGSLFFEHVFQENELKGFKQYMRLNMQGIEISFQRIFHDSELIEIAKTWQKTFNVISDPIVIVDSSYRILRCNKSFQKLHFSDFKGQMSHIQRKSIHQMNIGSRLFEVRCFPMDLKIGLEKISENKVYIYRDITNAKKLYSQVIQNEKMAALGHLAGNITHELNNPLTGMRAMSQIIASEVESHSQLYKDIIEIEKGLKRCQEVIKNLLEFTTTHTALDIVELDDLIQKTLSFLKAATRMHKLDISLNSKRSYVKVSSQLIQQVIFNLINNSCQAIKDGGEIVIETNIINHNESDFVELKVSDNGPGIPKDIRDQIFLPFVTTKAASKGTGLGLYLCKNIIEKYNGEIFHNINFQEGTQFVVRLPLIKNN